MELVLPVVVAPGRHAHGQLDAAQTHRVAEEQAVAQDGSHVVPGILVRETGEDGISPGKTHLLDDVVGRDVVVNIPKIHLGKGLFQQTHRLQRLHIVLIGLLSVQFHGVGIGHHLALQGYGTQAVALEFQGQELAGSIFQRGKQADIRVGEHLGLPGFQVNLPQVGNAGIIGAADEVFVIQGETELSQVGIFPGEQFYGIEDGLGQLPGVEQQEGMLSVVSLARHGQPLAVVADSHV